MSDDPIRDAAEKIEGEVREGSRLAEAWDALCSRLAALEAENETLRQLVEDWRAYYAAALKEPCDDERHCTCVPGLRREIDRLRRIVAAVKEAAKKELEEHEP